MYKNSLENSSQLPLKKKYVFHTYGHKLRKFIEKEGEGLNDNVHME